MKEDSPILFKDPTGITKGVRGALYLYAVVTLIGLISEILNINTVLAVKSSNFASQEAMDAAIEAYSNRQDAVGLVLLFVSLITAVLFLIWFYRANRNVRALGAKGLEYSPGYAVSTFFIPGASVWKPYRGMVELWKASVNPVQWRTVKASPLLPWWWGFWIVTGIVSLIAVSFSSMTTMTWDDALGLSIADLIINALDLPLTALLILIVNRIYSRQMAHATQIEHWSSK